MALRVLILHGWNGSEPPHWQDWLAKKLESEGIIVSFPELPKKDHPDRDEWVATALEEIERFKPNAVVCHSLGCTLWFHLVNTYQIEGIEKLLLVSPPYNQTEIPTIATFFPVETPKELQAKQTLMVVSDDDPYLSMKQAGELFQTLDVKTKILQEAGHINSESGFGPLPLAYDFLISE